jgi:hypothetical protein
MLSASAPGGSAGGSFAGAVGQAGLGTLGSYQQQKEARKGELHKRVGAEIDYEVAKGKMDYYKRGGGKGAAARKQLKTDDKGNMVVVDLDVGEATPVLDVNGNPIKAGGKDQKQGSFQISEQAFEAVHQCDNITDPAARKKCQERRLNFAAGFKEDTDDPLLKELQKESDYKAKFMTELYKVRSDKESVQRYPVMDASGKMVKKRWNELSTEQQFDILEGDLDQFMQRVYGDRGSPTKRTGTASTQPEARAVPPPAANFGLTAEQIASIPEGKTALLKKSGKKVRKVNGRLVEIP